MRPILALNCLLQIVQERSEEESSVGGALALAFRHFSARNRQPVTVYINMSMCLLENKDKFTSYSVKQRFTATQNI